MAMKIEAFQLNRENGTFNAGGSFGVIEDIRGPQNKPPLLIGTLECIGIILVIGLVISVIAVILVYLAGLFSYYALVPTGLALLGVFIVGFTHDFLEDKSRGYVFQFSTTQTKFRFKGRRVDVYRRFDETKKASENSRNDKHLPREDYIVSIPQMPQLVLHTLRYGIRNLMMSGAWRVKAGDWVKQGDEIVSYYGRDDTLFRNATTISIVAPFPGKIIACGILDCGYQDLSSPHNVLIRLQPTKGSESQNVALNAYSQVIGYVDRFVNEPQSRRRPSLLERWIVPEIELAVQKLDCEAVNRAIDMLRTADCEKTPANL